MKVELRIFKAILDDHAWRPFILHKEDGSMWLNLQRYSDNESYLPIGGDYVSGFLFTQKLYEDRYRTEDNLVRFEMEEPPLPPRKEWRLVRRPYMVPMRMDAKEYANYPDNIPVLYSERWEQVETP